MKASALSTRSTFVYFWLGILTGAIIVLATLMIQSIASNGAANVFGRPMQTQNYVQMGGQPNRPSSNVNLKSMGGQPNMPTNNIKLKSMGGQPN